MPLSLSISHYLRVLESCVINPIYNSFKGLDLLTKDEGLCSKVNNITKIVRLRGL